MWKILLGYYVEIITIFLQGCENLIFACASTSKHCSKDIDKIHLKMPIPPKFWLTLIILSLCWIFFASLQNICQLDWIWIISSKYTQKKPKWRKTHFVIYLSKINVIAGGAKSVLLSWFPLKDMNKMQQKKPLLKFIW